MKTVLPGDAENLENTPIAMTIGNFDGVHLGHQSLLGTLLETANEVNASPLVLSFDPHPAQFFAKQAEFWRLFALDDQIQKLEQLGLEFFFVEKFTKEFASLKARAFLEDFVFARFDIKALVVGYDFSFGSDRLSDFSKLCEICEDRGVVVKQVAPLIVGEDVVSSSRIRGLVRSGQVEMASSLLGRDFYINGRVTRGDQRGRQLGFPTANMLIDPATVPLSGVYATKVIINGNEYGAISNLGTRPTFESIEKGVFLETHLFHFNEEIYDKEIRVLFKGFIREEKRFENSDELKEQIEIDIKKAKEILS